MSIQRRFICFTFLAFLSAVTCINAAVRPGKGMDIAPGDVAEYRTVMSSPDGAVLAQVSSIMIAAGSEGDLEQVIVLSVVDEKVKGSQTVLYDLTKERMEQGELIDSGTESITIQGQQIECSWQKRRTGEIAATFWRSSRLPFEHLAKMIMETPDGRKQTTELIYFGPPDVETEESKMFQVRLSGFLSRQR